MNRWSWTRTAVALALTCGAARILLWLPLPGVDADVASELDVGTLNVLVGSGALWLVGIRAARALAPRSAGLAHRLALVVFLAVMALNALIAAVLLEPWSLAGPPLVPDPGWGFRVVAVVTMVAAQAIVWWLADWIDRSGRVNGALVLWALVMLLPGVGRWSGELVGAIRLGQIGEAALLVVPFALFPGGVVATVLALRGWQYPARLGPGLTARSGLDVLLGSAFAGALAILPLIRYEPAPGLAGLVGIPLVGGVVGLGALVLLSRHPPWPRVWWVVAGAVAPLVVGGLGWAVVEALRPGRFDGDRDLAVEIASDEGTAAVDEPILRERFRELGVSADITPMSDRRLAVALQGVSDPEAVLELVLVQGQLEVREVLGEEGTVPGVAHRERCAPGDWCPGYVLAPSRLLTNDDVRNASVQRDTTGMPYLELDLTKAGTERFGEATGKLVGRQIAIVVDGAVWSAPIVREEIHTGSVRVPVAVPEDEELVSVLRTDRLRSRWVVASGDP